MKRRRIFLWIGGVVAAYWFVMTAFDWWLTRSVEGVACAELSRADLIGAGLDFAPRTTMEKQLLQAYVRAARGEPYPDCTISHTSYRCHQTGRSMVEVSHYGKRRYFEIPDGRAAVLYGREGWANCVLQVAGEG